MKVLWDGQSPMQRCFTTSWIPQHKDWEILPVQTFQGDGADSVASVFRTGVHILRIISPEIGMLRI
jgi:hypothetical protein